MDDIPGSNGFAFFRLVVNLAAYSGRKLVSAFETRGVQVARLGGMIREVAIQNFGYFEAELDNSTNIEVRIRDLHQMIG